MKKEFSISALNLGLYNEGILTGSWLELPTTQEKINEYLKDDVMIDVENEEYEIADVDDFPFDYDVAQWSSITDLNKLAIIYSSLDENQKDAVYGYYNQYVSRANINQIINLCMQVNEIEYYQYEDFGIQGLSNEEKIGYMMAHENGLYEILERENVEHCFDFEKYGIEWSYDYFLLENGYLVDGGNIDLNYYNQKDINERVVEILNKNLVEKEVEEIEI